MHLYTVLWVVVATVFCMLSQKRQLPSRYAIAGHEPVEVYPESFGRIEVKPISNWRGWWGTTGSSSMAMVPPVRRACWPVTGGEWRGTYHVRGGETTV